MQPVTITISGEYLDSQIYAGHLYLFGISGDIITLDWNNLIEDFSIDESLRLAVMAAFQKSDLFYHSRNVLFQDQDIKNVILSKFDELARKDLTVSDKKMLSLKVGHQDNRFPFPHNDSQIYGKTLYVGSQKGIHSAAIEKWTKTKCLISACIKEKWDCHVSAMSASYGCLALAAGSEGLFEMSLFHEAEPKNLSNQNCIDCNWTFYSIYASSHVCSGYLAEFEKEKFEKENHFDFEEENSYRQRRICIQRNFKGLIPDEKIFGYSGYSCGAHDKLYQVRDRSVHVVRYQPWKKSKLQHIGDLELPERKDQVISAKVASFGVIIEYENAIVVLPSDDGTPITFKGEPVNWRIFPRSKYYENQLHIIYEDRIEIISFNHDYFVNQKSKRAGIEVFQIN